MVVKSLQTTPGFSGGEKQCSLPSGLAQPSPGKRMADFQQAPDFLLVRAVEITLVHPRRWNPFAVTRRSGFGGIRA
ncbi:MAG: hypothetical protein JO134_07255 [Xanthobacteraceae bacterium]|nr:hypothetical protein [Xanthobacteraceae bacterium]